MTGRILLPALALGLFLIGIALGLAGILDEGDSITRAGIVLSTASLPPLIVWQSRKAHQKADDELATAHKAGYRLALRHVAQGLLDQDTAPPDGGARATLGGDRAALTSNRSDNTQSDEHNPAANVRRLHVIRHDPEGRKQAAQ
ncbi:hypothetical protein [Streptomyces chryseus]